MDDDAKTRRRLQKREATRKWRESLTPEGIEAEKVKNLDSQKRRRVLAKMVQKITVGKREEKAGRCECYF
jgi:hypothetical protein